MNLKAGIYVRVSTEEQRDYGYSIDGQIRELNDYCKRQNYTIVDIYNDAGHSASFELVSYAIKEDDFMISKK